MTNKKLLFNIELSRKDVVRSLKLPSIIDRELAYLCGILIGDGSIYKRDNKNDYIIKCVGNPHDEKELYHEVIGTKFRKVFGFVPNIKLQDSNTTYGFTIHSKSIFKYLTEVIGLKYGRKDQRLKIPDIFLEDKGLLLILIKGIFDTDGCISFKKRYKENPYYPVITISSKSKKLIQQISSFLKNKDFKIVEVYDYKVKDLRNSRGYTVINRIEMNGRDNLKNWLLKVGFESPKHLKKIKKYWKEK